MMEKLKKFDNRKTNKYRTKLRDDRLVYNELNNLFNYAVNDKRNHLHETFSLLEEHLNKYPQSISNQMYLLSHIASESFKMFHKNKELILLKKSLAFILELCLVCEKKSMDTNSPKKIILVLSPYLENISVCFNFFILIIIIFRHFQKIMVLILFIVV